MKRIVVLIAVLSVLWPGTAQTFIRSLPTSTNLTGSTKIPVDDATYGTRAVTLQNLLASTATNATLLAAITNVVEDTATSLLGNKLDATNGVAVNLAGSLTNVSVNGGRPTTDTRATSALFFGDSVVAGSSATTTANTWWRLVSDHYGWTHTNLAFGGAVVTDLNWESQRGYSVTNYYNNVLYTTPLSTATNLTVFAKVGINDGADFPTTSVSHAAYLTHYYQSWLAFAAYWATPGKTLATAATESGTWTDWNNYFGSAAGNSSTTSGDTLTFTTMGDAVYVAFPVSLTNTTSFGKFWVSIDGTAVDLVNPNGVGFGNRNQYGTPSAFIPYSATNAFWAKRYAGYGQRRHTVLITATNNASLPTVINWVAGSQQPIGPNSGPSVFLLENLNRAADATRDATYSALRAQVNQVANQLGGDGLQVAIIRPNSVYDSANSGDGIHPNDAGMVQVAQAVRQAVDRFRGLAITAGQGAASSGLSAAGSGLSESSGTVSLGGTLTANATLTGGTYGVQASRTQANEPVLELFPGASTYGLEVTGDTSFMEVLTSSGSPSTYWRKANGTVASPTAALNGDNLGRLYFMGFGSGGYEFGAAILANAAENFSSTAAGSSLNFYTTPTTTDALQLAMTINASGNVVMAYDLTADDITGASLSIPNAGATPAIVTRYNTGVSGANIHLRHARGTSGSPTALAANDSIGTINFVPYDGTGFNVSAAQITGFSGESMTGSAAGSGINFLTTPTGSTTPALAMTINPSGNVSMSYDLTVDDVTAGTLSIPNAGATPLVVTRYNTGTSGANIHLRHARGTSGSPTALSINDSIGTLNFVPHDGNGFNVSAAQIIAFAGESMTNTAVGTGLSFYTTPTGSITPAVSLVLNPSGSASFASGIGATTFTGTTTGTGLTLNGDGSFGIIANRNSNSGGKEFAIQRSRASSTAVQSGDAIGTLGFYGHNGTTYPGRNAGVRALATETHSGSASGTKVVISATATGSTSTTDQLTVNGGSVEVAGSIELGHASDTTLARSAAGVVTIEGVTVAERPTTTALTYSGTNVTLTATSHVLHGNTLTLTNNCLLTITSSDGASGGVTIVPHASTSYTVYLDSAIKLLGGGSSFVVTNSASETVNLEWKQTLRGGSSVILANKAVYP